MLSNGICDVSFDGLQFCKNFVPFQNRIRASTQGFTARAGGSGGAGGVTRHPTYSAHPPYPPFHKTWRGASAPRSQA